MAQKLPTWSWLLVGVIIAVFSLYLEIGLFLWLGMLFIAIGVAKIVIRYMTGTKETSQEKKAVQQYAPKMHPAHQYYRCSCGNPVRAADFFCSNCGRRLR